MKIIQWFKEQSIILKIAYITLGASIIMFLLYFVFVRGNFSNESIEWANFGAYFGSITGLLAFVGVLYSASLSEKRAEKAEQESIKREERDQFFRLIEQLRFNSLQFSSTNSTQLDKDVIKLNDYLVSNILYLFIKNFDQKHWEKFYEEYNLTEAERASRVNLDLEEKIVEIVIKHNNILKMKDKLDVSQSEDIIIIKNITDNLTHKTFKIYCKEYDISIDSNTIKRKTLDDLFEFCESKLTNEIIIISIIKTYAAYYSIMNGYMTLLKNISLIVETIDKYLPSTKEYYYQVLSSQLKSNELVILFYYLFSNNFDYNKIGMFSNKNLFTNLCYRDLVIIDIPKNKNNEDILLSQILSEYLQTK